MALFDTIASFYGCLALIVGACVGSFVTAVSHRLPQDEDIVFKPSYCPHCNMVLRAIDLVPIFSWAARGGRCRGCGARVSLRYPLTEICAALLFLLVYVLFGVTWIALVMALFVTCLLILIVTDLEHYIIPDSMQLALFLLAIPYHILLQDGWREPAFGALIGVGMGAALRYGYLYLRKLDALGMGDVKFLLVAGWWLGVGPLVILFMLSGLLGTIMGVLWRIAGRGEKFPFGPALAAALCVCVFGRGTLSSIEWLSPFYHLGGSAL